MIELPPELEQQLRSAAAQEGRAPEEFVRELVRERLMEARVAQLERNRAAIALMDEWLNTDLTDEGDREWEELRRGLEANRRATGARSLFNG